MKLRKLKIEDAPLMLEWMHDNSVVKDLQTNFASKTIEDCKRFINNSIEDTEKLYGIAALIKMNGAEMDVLDGTRSLNLAIVDETDEYMGTVSLKNIYKDTAEFGIAIRSRAMGKGLAISAMQEIIKLGWEKFLMKQLYWCVDKKNDRALRFYDKNNYERTDVVNSEIGDIIRNLGTYPEAKLEEYVWYVENTKGLSHDAIKIITEALSVEESDVHNIKVMKAGMTNRSYVFTCHEKRYIMRIPGEGTDRLINREEEYYVYQTIKDKGLSDNIVYIDPENGCKITEYVEGARNCDAFNDDDVKKCMARLRRFHEMKVEVTHAFDIFAHIDYYESLWDGKESCFCDYKQTKAKVWELKRYIDIHKKEYQLTHIDAVPDNFLFSEKDGKEIISLIDWEYSAMQDPDVDLAMFCIYAMYDREQVEKLIDSYYTEGCDREVRIKIYCYIAACGLLWSNWCEYKRALGVEFGEYADCQYRYATDYYDIVMQELKK